MNNERVTPKNAAKELQMDVITLRELMKREKLPIGYAIKREGKHISPPFGSGERTTWYRLSIRKDCLIDIF